MKAVPILLAAALLAGCSGMGMHRSSGTGSTMSSSMGSTMDNSSSFQSRAYGPATPLEGPNSGINSSAY